MTSRNNDVVDMIVIRKANNAFIAEDRYSTGNYK